MEWTINRDTKYYIPVCNTEGKYIEEGFVVSVKERDGVYIRRYRKVLQTNEKWQSLVEYGEFVDWISPEHPKWADIEEDVTGIVKNYYAGTTELQAISRILHIIYEKGVVIELEMKYTSLLLARISG